MPSVGLVDRLDFPSRHYPELHRNAQPPQIFTGCGIHGVLGVTLDYGIAQRVNDAAILKLLQTFAKGSTGRGFSGAHCGYGVWITHQEHKKSADPHQAAEYSVESFVRELAPAHRPFRVKAPCRLQRQVAGFGVPNHS